MIKTWFLRTKNIERMIEIEKAKTKNDTKIECQKMFDRDLLDVQIKYEDILSSLKKHIKGLEKQHAKDNEAYRLYREDERILQERYEEFDPKMHDIFMMMTKGFQMFQNEKRLIDNSVENSEKKSSKIEKLIKSA